MRAWIVAGVAGLALAGGLRARAGEEPPLKTQAVNVSKADKAEVEAILKQALGPRGKFVFLQGNKTVVITDEQANLEAAAVLLGSVANPAPAPNVRVVVTWAETDDSQRTGFVAGREPVRRRTPGTRIEVDPVVIDVLGQSSSTSSMASQFLVCKSGGSASLAVVRDAPLPQWEYSEVILEYIGREARLTEIVTPEIRWESLGTRLNIRPVVRDDLITVEVAPEISGTAGGDRRSVVLRSLATTVTVANGAELSLGGFSAASEEFNRGFFGNAEGGTRLSGARGGSFTLRATIE